ncbi:hypothetical protein M422DRAFT_273057 [Sphaerobolus stellatus SS14]|uniref:Integrase zinc-binding domain-containing protein n=1 Tax=Sphaerobolus stellatus (strain SS14) TaxID=990650 RepID=A0A0C9TVW3_SPHS4|nr:hypothetical protein M422DRAFT_273057 [Sphaerobolus stellatus SS14]
MTRWIAYMQLFDFEMKHVKAEQHKAPDGLSRRPQALSDIECDDTEPFLEKLIEIGGIQRQLHITERRGPEEVIYSSAEVNLDLIPEARTLDYEDWDPDAHTSRLAYSLIKNGTDLSFVGMDFYDRHVPIEVVDSQCMLGGETVSLLITYYEWAYMGKLNEGGSKPSYFTNLDARRVSVSHRYDHGEDFEWIDDPAPEAIACIGHKFGVKDKDTPKMWNDIISFLKDKLLPDKLPAQSKEGKKFIKFANRFFLYQENLYFAPTRKGERQPRLVIRDKDRHSKLLIEAHDRCGHFGCDPTYKHLQDSIIGRTCTTRLPTTLVRVTHASSTLVTNL